MLSAMWPKSRLALLWPMSWKYPIKVCHEKHLVTVKWPCVCVCVCVCVRLLVAQSHLTCCNPMDFSHQAPLSVEFSRQEYWSGLVSSVAQKCPTLQSHGLQYIRPPCPSPTSRAYSNSCPLRHWCHPTISSSVIPFSSHLQSFPAPGSFQMSQFFTSGGQSIGVSASASVLLMNIQDWFPLGNILCMFFLGVLWHYVLYLHLSAILSLFLCVVWGSVLTSLIYAAVQLAQCCMLERLSSQL